MEIKGIEVKRDYIYILIILIIIIMFFINKGCDRREADKLASDIVNYKTEAKIYKTKHGLEVSTNTALILKTQFQMKALLSSNDTLKEWVSKFKEIKGGVIVRETTIVREVAVPFDKIIPCDFKPFKANKISNDFMFYSTIANTGLTIDSLKIPNKAEIIIGMRRDNIFKKAKMVVDIHNSNPYVKTSDISGFVYTPEKKWYERPLVGFVFGIGVGFIGGEYVNVKLNK